MAQRTIDLPCIADTWIDAANPTTNYGSATTLKGGSDYQAQSYIVLAFNTNLYPARKKLISVNLLIYNLEYRKTSESWASMYCIFPTIAWGEYTLNWNNALPMLAANSCRNTTYTTLPQNTYINIDFAQFDDSTTGEKVVPVVSNMANIIIAWDDPGISAAHPGINDNMKIASRETANPPKLRIVYEDIPPSTPTPIDPIGSYKDRSSVIRFTWQYNSAVGGVQNKFDLLWSTNGTSWTTVSQVTANNYYDMPVNTLPTGTIQWKVKTYNEYGEYAESPVSVFTCIGVPAVPIITGITNKDTPKPTISWSSVSQQVYQVQILQGSNIVYDTGSIPGISVRSHMVTSFLDDGIYIAKVRIKNEYDLFSEWAVAQFTIATPKPEKPSITLLNQKYSIEVTSNLADNSYLLLFRKEIGAVGFKCIAKSTASVIKDYTVESNRQYQYFVRAVSNTGTYLDSDIKNIVSTTFKMSVLSPVTNLTNTFEIKHNLKERPAKSIKVSTPNSSNYFSGRKYPVVEYSEHLDYAIALTFFIKDDAAFQRLLDILYLKGVVLYRDKRRKFYGNISEINVTDHFAGYVVNLSINQTDYDEYLEV